MSEKTRKRTKAAAAPPLDSAHWWPLDKMRGYCHEHMRDRRIADLALLAAVNAGELPGKIIWFDEQTSPPVPHTILLLVEDYELKAVDFYKVWHVQPRRPDVPVLPRHALFFWGPKAKQLWPMEEAVSALAEQQAADPFKPPRRRPGPVPENEWKQAVVRELLKRAKAGKPPPSATDMLEFCGSTLEWEPDRRSMQELLRLFAGEMWYLLGLG